MHYDRVQNTISEPHTNSEAAAPETFYSSGTTYIDLGLTSGEERM
jgi:hypothetical protein